ncbi:MAG: PQQ-binding-like beta-propeller repeat protein [Planctomycetota bacterium]
MIAKTQVTSWKLKVLLTFVSLAASTVALGDERWTSFRNGGPNRAASDKLPLVWSPTNGIAWQRETPGYGQSSPLLWDGRLYLTAVKGPLKDEGVIVAMDTNSGETHWKRAFPTSHPEANFDQKCRAASTPVVDETGIYAFFSSGDVFAVSHAGDVLWRRRLRQEYGDFENGHGLGSSLAQTEDAVIVLVDHQGPSYLLAIDKRNGENLWKAERSSRTSWASPVVAKIRGREQIVVSSNGSVDGYDARSGALVWSVTDVGGNSISSATVAGNRVFAGASASGFSGRNASGTSCCIVVKGDRNPSADIAWRAEKASCHYVSVVEDGGLTWHVNNVGVVFCLDAATGKSHYKARTTGMCWATPLVAGGHLYLFGKNGRTMVIKAGPEFEEVAVNELWDAKNPPMPERYTPYRPTQSSQSDPMQQAMEQLRSSDRNKDGVIEREELPSQLRPFFPQLDTNRDRKIDKAEVNAMAARISEGRSSDSAESYGDPIVYGVAASDDALYLRTGTRVYCVGTTNQ